MTCPRREPCSLQAVYLDEFAQKLTDPRDKKLAVRQAKAFKLQLKQVRLHVMGALLQGLLFCGGAALRITRRGAHVLTGCHRLGLRGWVAAAQLRLRAAAAHSVPSFDILRPRAAAAHSVPSFDILRPRAAAAHSVPSFDILRPCAAAAHSVPSFDILWRAMPQALKYKEKMQTSFRNATLAGAKVSVRCSDTGVLWVLCWGGALSHLYGRMRCICGLHQLMAMRLRKGPGHSSGWPHIVCTCSTYPRSVCSMCAHAARAAPACFHQDACAHARTLVDLQTCRRLRVEVCFPMPMCAHTRAGTHAQTHIN